MFVSFFLFPPYRFGLFFCYIRGGYCRSNWRKDSYLHFARWHHHSSLRYVLPISAIVPLTLLYTVSGSWPRSSWMGACWMLIALSQYCMTEQLPFIESREGLSCQKSVTVFNISIKMERCEVQRPQNKQSEHSEKSIKTIDCPRPLSTDNCNWCYKPCDCVTKHDIKVKTARGIKLVRVALLLLLPPQKFNSSPPTLLGPPLPFIVKEIPFKCPL